MRNASAVAGASNFANAWMDRMADRECGVDAGRAASAGYNRCGRAVGFLMLSVVHHASLSHDSVAGGNAQIDHGISVNGISVPDISVKPRRAQRPVIPNGRDRYFRWEPVCEVPWRSRQRLLFGWPAGLVFRFLTGFQPAGTNPSAARKRGTPWRFTTRDL